MKKKKETSKKSAKTPKKAKAAKKNVKEITHTHAKEENFEPSTLDQVWGDTGLGKYKTFDESIYRERLDNMAKTDLQAHATRVGLVPIDNRSTLTQRLMREFRKHINLFKPTNIKISKSIAKDSLPLGVRKTLDEGK